MNFIPTNLNALTDVVARVTALTAHDRSLLVEAGAGSGKTAVMAGRVALMLAGGIAPKAIAAVTFTELAASELLARVREFVDALIAGSIPTELRSALPGGLSARQCANLAQAAAAIDEITCSTIHGFCQRLIKPYPVEADIDPGASVADRGQADLAFTEIVDAWLRDRLSGTEGGLVAEMVLHDPDATLSAIRKIADILRHRRSVAANPGRPIEPLVRDFRAAAAALREFVDRAPACEEDTVAIAAKFAEMADRVAFASSSVDAPGLVRLLATKAHPDLCKRDGDFKAYQKKGKWCTAARCVGLSKADGDRFSADAERHYQACYEAWTALVANCASRALAELVDEVRPILDRFRDHKRAAALLDFDDLIFAARDLLKNHEDVRQALGRRYAHVLVDEFQDTDPLQTEIFWRLCGDPPAGDPTADWAEFAIRPGALFLVGDPKQAIYRFRGADVHAYIRARNTIRALGDNVLSISTNFRSCSSILAYVNDRFQPILSRDGQPGFTALDPFHDDHGEGPCVAALDVAVADENGRASYDRQRDGEAEAVAGMCARLIGSRRIVDWKSGQARLCRAGDIALLAPTGTELWRYEEAFERRGIPVSTQAGKGLFRRQEIQDLIAITRVLADRRDTLALLALLRGPLVGLSEEELLDIVWALPRSDARPEELPRLDLNLDAANIGHTLARETIEKLQSLARRANATTPYDLLAQAVDVLRVRPILRQRHRHAERALSNVDLYLSLARPYAVRGIRAFAEAMTAAWSDATKTVEGRPDAQEEAVALYTMHAAKGLEWPIVVPINTMTSVNDGDAEIVDRGTDRIYCPIFGVHPVGYDAVRAAEKAELDRERIRLWYVAATRARELLVLPRLDVRAGRNAWSRLLDLDLAGLPAIDLSALSPSVEPTREAAANAQTRESFAAEAHEIAARQRQLKWSAPSRDEGWAGAPQAQRERDIIFSAEDRDLEADAPQLVQGGRERGLVIHKLFEEVLTGETGDDLDALEARAATLIRALGLEPAHDPALGLSAIEIAGCVARTLSLPEIAAVRATLVPEFPVYASHECDGVEHALVGIVDALGLRPDGAPALVIDWKSDVDPSEEMIEHYRGQVRSYLDATSVPEGLIVFVTRGQVVRVTAPSRLTSQSVPG